jgi:predicted dienelactone hydrolase
LSLGGATALLTGFHARYGDSRAGAVLSIAGVSCMFTQSFFAKSLPVLFLQGDADLIAPPEANSERSFPLAEDPRELVLLKSGSHTAFAGFATLLDGSMNYDKLGCSVLNVQAPPSFSGLGSADEGIAQDSSVCPQPCTGTPITPSLDATRQEELTKIVGLAFFDEFLRAKKSATSYLAGPLATENPEVTLKLKP